MTEAGILQEEIDSRRGGYGALLAEFWASFSENRGAVYGLFFSSQLSSLPFSPILSPRINRTNSSGMPSCNRPSGRLAASGAFPSAPTLWAEMSSPG
jgi:hypothetical protein